MLKNTINKLADSVQGGSTFSDALRPSEDLCLSVLGGFWHFRLEFQEKAAKIKNKVLSAMVYPIIVMTMAVGIMCFLLVFIVPRFEAIFHDLLATNRRRL